MIVKGWDHPHVIYQTPGEDEMANEALLAHIDSGASIVISQAENSLVIDRGTVPELIKVLKILEKAKS